MHAQAYRYDHFERRMLAEDSEFSGGPSNRQRFPRFDLPTAFGSRLTSEDVHARPFVMILSSFT